MYHADSWEVHAKNKLYAKDFTYSKTFLSATQKEYQKLVFKTDYRLMQVKSIAECFKGNILHYF